LTATFFTAMWLSLRGIPFLLDLVCFRLCLEEFLTCLHIGKILEGREVLRFIRWCQFAFFGVFGKRNLRRFKDLKSSIEDILISFFHTLYL
jgi:hypothetical protein